MNNENIIATKLTTVVQNDGDVRVTKSKAVFTDLEGTTEPEPGAPSFMMHFDDGRVYEVTVKLVHEPDEEEAEMIAHCKVFDIHGRPRR